jgi:poly-gamma-glutamate capsule biosynthesis protein CapA/YwtB (metallophosphatase superfamily)
MLLWQNKNARVAFRIAIAGDYLPAAGLHPPAAHGWTSMAANLSNYFQDVDLSIVNLECPLDVESCAVRPKIGLGDSFAAPSASLEYLPPLRARVVGLANNHIYDYGEEGLQRTKHAVVQHGIIPLGSGRSLDEAADVYVATTPLGVRIGFWAAACNLPELASRTRSGVEPATRARGRDAFASLKRLGAHLCIAFLHAGIEHTNRPDPNDVALMDDMVGFGFDIVAASHSHRIAGFRSTINKTARAAFCFYGLGSLSSGIRYSKLEHEGMLVVIGLDRDGDIAQVEMRPIQLSADGWGTVADPATADHINNHFLLLSAEVADGSYKQHFYHDSGKDLVERQYRNLQAAYRTGGIPGVARILSRIRMRHLNRAFYRALGV